MKKKTLVATIFLVLHLNSAFSQSKMNVATIEAGKSKYQISRYIYSHFSEHLGNCIYDGLWVGENSPVPNIKGIRTDVAQALKRIKVPALRWPGGCFADEYHWKDGIGPKNQRPKMINTNWGGVTENNSFGTHEFMELCAQLGCEPYISGNLGSGTVQEMSQWVEYLNSDNESPMTGIRQSNGREKSWGVKFWGVGNESWGCGGRMKPGYYSDKALNYSSFLKNYGDNQLKLIAVGPNGDDYKWTKEVMQEIGNKFWGIALHYYTNHGASATNFKEDEWFKVLKSTLKMEELIANHSAIMDTYDANKRIALVVDEWGTWYNTEPGTNPGFLFQQNSLRDALVAGINLNIFNNHCDRVKMTAIAQIVNVLQSVILTKGEKMVLTPTYYVYDLYKVHQDATMVPTKLECENYIFKGEKIPALNISTSIDNNGKMHISICNLNAVKAVPLTCDLKGFSISSISGQLLTASQINSFNSFENPENLSVKLFSDFKYYKEKINVQLPPHSVVMLEVLGNQTIPDKSIVLKNIARGLNYKLFKGEWTKLPDFNSLNSVKEGIVSGMEIPSEIIGNNFGLEFYGYIKIDKAGMYNFKLTSDDGAKLFIDREEIIDNDGSHAMIEQQGSTLLSKGFHLIRSTYFQHGGGSGYKLSYSSEYIDYQSLSEDLLYHSVN